MRFISTSILIFFLIGCEVINQDEDVPSIINIQSIEVEGNHTSKITDAWVYIDGEFKGVFPLPSEFPVLKVGQQTIIIEGGIKKNGIASSRDNYPYYDSFTIDADLVENQKLTLNPKLSYSINSFPFNENFEGVGTNLEILSDSVSHTLEKVYDNSNVKLGNYHSKSVISGEYGELFECATGNINLPKNKAVYLEMDYKCNSTIIVGMYANGISTNTKNAIIYLNKKEDWNKIYLSLSEIIANYNDAISYKLFFAIPRDTSYSQNEMYLDNIRLVYEE